MSKKYLFLGLLLVSFLVAPLSSSALTTAEQIAQLQQQILMLQAQLRQLQSQQPNPWCHTFNVSFGVGTNNQEAGSLIQALAKEGLLNYSQTTYFSESVAAAVSAFQLKYKSEILTPLGLTTPTGYVGPSTRRALNRLYGCGIVRPIPSNLPPVISGVSGPTTLNVGQVGTWSVQASDPENGVLSYSVIWGDEAMTTSGSAPNYNYLAETIQQTSTFTHSYAQAGTYYPTFTVRDNSGQSARTSLSVVVGTNVDNRITILTPKGGEVWPIGSWQDIVFKLPDNFVDPKIAPMNVGVSFENGPTNGFVINATDLQQMSDGSFRIKTLVRLAPINQNSQPILRPGQYKVKLELFETIAALPCIGCVGISSGLLAVGISDGYVTVADSPQTIKTITVTSPNGGEQWVANSTKTISWRYDGATSNTKVDLWLQAPMPVCPPGMACAQFMPRSITLDKNISALSTYNWIVATDIINNPIASGQYQVYVCPAGSSSAYSTGCDSSDNYFTILAQ